MKKAIIVDLDGTLCDVSHRVHLVENEPVDVEKFHSSLVHDTMNDWCFQLIKAMSALGVEVILLTGRGEEYRQETEAWLMKQSVGYQALYMRRVKDDRTDATVKKEVYINNLKNTYETLFVVEDRKSVVEMWREIGVTCLQCDWGDF